MPDTTTQIRLELRNPDTRKTLEQIIRGIEGMAIQTTAGSTRPDILIYELSDDPDRDFNHIESILIAQEAGDVILTSGTSDRDVLLRALRSGATEFLGQPLQEEEVRQALRRYQEKKKHLGSPQQLGSIIEVIGSKGGVGTTTIAVNLANCLSRRSEVGPVALVDMNTITGEVPLFLELESGPHWSEIVKNISRVDVTYLMNIMTKYDAHLYVLASPGTPGHPTVAPEIVERVFALLRKAFRFIIVDAGVSLTGPSRAVLQMTNQALLVSTLSLPCLANTNKILNSFNYWGYPTRQQTRIVINRFIKNSDITLEDAKNTLQRRIFWTFPNDFKTTMAAINQGEPLTRIAPRAPISTSFEEMAGTITARDEAGEVKARGVLKKFLGSKKKSIEKKDKKVAWQT